MQGYVCGSVYIAGGYLSLFGNVIMGGNDKLRLSREIYKGRIKKGNVAGNFLLE
jgi:hypothetical protein